jgi:DNA uptake protein ComE-like DNA-binding protein
MPRIATIAGLGLAAALTLSACSGGSSTSAPATSAATAASTAASVATAASSASAAAAVTARINANTASQAELEAAFAAAGISNAAKWAREVAEYRPYQADPTWAQLRQELGKYNIDPAVLEQIIALLEV